MRSQATVPQSDSTRSSNPSDNDNNNPQSSRSANSAGGGRSSHNSSPSNDRSSMAAAGVPGLVNLTGYWRLNHADSDNTSHMAHIHGVPWSCLLTHQQGQPQSQGSSTAGAGGNGSHASATVTEYLAIHQRKTGPKEEIVVVFQSPSSDRYIGYVIRLFLVCGLDVVIIACCNYFRSLHHVRYQVGTLNFSEWKGIYVLREVCACDTDFSRMCLWQLGPKKGQRRLV
jgi:hypothetical protein